MVEEHISEAAEWIAGNSQVVAVTGAGISTESGIPAFRGEAGLWKQFDMARCGSLQGFLTDPESAWRFFHKLYTHIQPASPNPAHYTLVALERLNRLSMVITQNIDGLHDASGQKNVIEVFGNIKSLSCNQCGKKISFESLLLSPVDIPPYCHCGGVLKPDVVLFEEPVPSSKLISAYQHIINAEVLLIIGTSGLVHPVSSLLQIARTQTRHIIEINIQRTILTDSLGTLFLQGSASQVLQKLCDIVKSRLTAR